MNPQQVAAIRANRLYIVDTLEPFVPFFATHFWVRNVIDREEKEKVQSAVTSREQLVMILEILQRKQGSWDIFLEFLVDKNLHPVAEVLREAVSANSKDGETDEPEPKRPERSPLAEFAFKLAQYYQLNYAHLPTMGESHTHVNDVWVPLQIDGRREDHLAADRIDHVELLSRLQSDKRHNVALIKGDPGIGKTTLAKKIAYDWAVNYRSTTAQQFSLVLAVPLRSAGKSNQFDLLAIDYCFSVIELEDVDKAKLVREVRQLKSQLLIILDGLDEYRSYSESPFMILFAAPFQHSTANCTVTPPMITFKLIITSRPYACKRANEDFVPLRFVILPLDNVHLSDFVNLHCQTPQGAAKVTEYLNVNPHLAIQVPLILTFVCFLADSVQEIPTNMTSLYDILIRQMMRREVGQGKLAEPVNMRRWKESKLIKTASKLAYRGYANYSKANVKDKVFKYEFSDDSLDKCHVTNDSFICGFLLPKFDFAKERLMAEFPHRSIQEFFAALQYYQLMLSGRKKAVEEIYNLIINVYQSQIGRFFFGICSNEGQFANLTEWLNPSALYPGAKISPNTAISGFGASLVDCSCEENRMIGQRLFESLGTFEETMLRSWDGHIQAITTYSLDCSGDFREGVHFEVIRRNTVGHPTVWVFACNRQSARLMGVRDELPSSLEVMFDTIDVLIWTIDNIYDASQLEMAFGRLKSFSLVKALLLRAFTAVSPEISVTYFIRYNRECGSKLTCFQFGYDVADRQKLLAIAEKEQFVSLTVDERNEKRDDDGDIFRLMKVTVCDDICQSTLVCFLMGLALLEDNGILISYYNCSNEGRTSSLAIFLFSIRVKERR